MGDKNQTPSSSSTALIVKDQEPQNPNPFLTLFSNFTKFFNFPLPKSPAPNPDAAGAGADNAKSKPKPPAVVTVPNRQTVAPLKLEAEDLEKDTNPVVLWQVYAIGGFFVLKWAWARWNERRAKKKSNEDPPAAASDE